MYRSNYTKCSHILRMVFSPSVSDLKGRFIELQVFKNLLESETYTEIIVTNNEKDYYRIRLNKRTMRIVVTRLEAEEDKI